MKVFNSSLRPAGGFIFKNPADGVEFSGDTPDDLVFKVRGYRKRKGQEIGDVYAEVHAALCKRTPRFCREQPDQRKLSDRVLESTMDALEDPKNLVKPDVAAKRAAACLRCPLRAPWKHLCMSCATKVTKLIPTITKGAALQKSLDGFACKQAGDDLQLAVCLDGPAVPGVPRECWRYKK